MSNNGNPCIQLSDVSVTFRSYSGVAPSLKRTVLATLLRRRTASRRDFVLFDRLNLTINSGERVGVIGPNGAGKSTLLRVIAGIYPPQKGQVRTAGRVIPLIELGTGMHPEMSGRDNITLSGTIFGFTPKQMKDKAERILEFAGLTAFADTPLKYYSAGMKKRLGFSIATEVEPEILLMDEVFAGGDASFIRKARQRIYSLLDASHVVVLVSHSLGRIREVASRVIWIEKGAVHMDGDPKSVCDAYTEHYDR